MKLGFYLATIRVPSAKRTWMLVTSRVASTFKGADVGLTIDGITGAGETGKLPGIDAVADPAGTILPSRCPCPEKADYVTRKVPSA